MIKTWDGHDVVKCVLCDKLYVSVSGKTNICHHCRNSVVPNQAYWDQSADSKPVYIKISSGTLGSPKRKYDSPEGPADSNGVSGSLRKAQKMQISYQKEKNVL